MGSSDQVVLDPATGLENQWYIFRCNIDDAWNLASGDGVVIADMIGDTAQPSGPLDSPRHGSRLQRVRRRDRCLHRRVVLSRHRGHGDRRGADNNLGMAGIAFDASLWPVQADSAPGPLWRGMRAGEGNRLGADDRLWWPSKIINLEVQTGTFGNFEMVPSVNAAIRTAIATA